ncbi:FKBP-type peptidyl-prolyl cis-trans isomerase [Alteromonas flava]|uniref:FKBP-type peptidyl-prolyl cis-trans isomerase n=1 Tax=Alteromonas flava TaxID=2048003 RepID=UPI000C28E935|nr:FKBP-type peptidyl-prolyl cis-trans isomerase [Alteromonas flava]
MRLSLVAATSLMALGLSACQPQSSEQATDSAPAETASTTDMSPAQNQAYAIGASMGTYVVNRATETEKYGMTFDREAVMQGFKDALAGNSKFTVEEMQTLARAADASLQEKQQAAAQDVAQQNIEAGKAFLAENAKKEGVMTTESGLQYEVLSAGEGASPTAEDTVTVHYRGTLLDGTEFDSSYKRNEPASFPLSRVIAGWTEGVQLMKEGGKFRFYIPSELAYGERATGAITPNSTLIFDVELLEVKKADAE